MKTMHHGEKYIASYYPNDEDFKTLKKGVLSEVPNTVDWFATVRMYIEGQLPPDGTTLTAEQIFAQPLIPASL